LLLTGCYSSLVVGRARTVPRGRFEILAAPGVTGTAVLGADPNVRPAIELGVRYGATERMDVGLRAGDAGVSAALRVQLVRAARAPGLDVMLAPGLAYTFTDKLAVELPCV